MASTTSDRLGQFRLILTDDERTEIAGLAERLAPTERGLVDRPGWQAAGRRMSCLLPTRLMETLRQYRHDPGPEGVMAIANLPVVDARLPPTPDEPDSVERVATLPATVTLLLGLQLGEVIAYRDEKQGALVQNVVPVPGLARSQSNAGAVELGLHTENAFHPNRPDFIGLTCLRTDRQERVGTIVSSIRQVLPGMGEHDRAVLNEERFVTAAPPSFHSAGRAGPHPVLSGCPDDPDLRVDFAATTALDDEARGALSRLHKAMVAGQSELVLEPNEMVFVDNRIVVHGRSEFAPRYDGQDRWLHRVFVHLDNRRSRARRAGNGHVLT